MSLVQPRGGGASKSDESQSVSVSSSEDNAVFKVLRSLDCIPPNWRFLLNKQTISSNNNNGEGIHISVSSSHTFCMLRFCWHLGVQDVRNVLFRPTQRTAFDDGFLYDSIEMIRKISPTDYIFKCQIVTMPRISRFFQKFWSKKVVLRVVQRPLPVDPNTGMSPGVAHVSVQWDPQHNIVRRFICCGILTPTASGGCRYLQLSLANNGANVPLFVYRLTIRSSFQTLRLLESNYIRNKKEKEAKRKEQKGKKD